MAETLPERKPTHVDLLKAYKLRVINRLSYGEIAETLGQPKSSIHRALNELISLLPDPEQQQAYQDARPALLTAVEERLIASLMDEDAIAKASLNNRAYCFQQIHQARRLEEGKSTENKSVMHTILDQAFNGAHASDENNGNNTQTLDVTPQEVSDDNKI